MAIAVVVLVLVSISIVIDLGVVVIVMRLLTAIPNPFIGDKGASSCSTTCLPGMDRQCKC